MVVQQIPLSERIKGAERGVVSQPEFCSCLIQQWAETPIKAYFGRSSFRWRPLFRRLGLEPTANPTYQEVAAMIHETDEEFTAELFILANPIWEAERGREEHETQ